MSAGIVAEVEPQSRASSVLRTLVLCDLVDSTGLVERMGDLAAAELIRKHDRLARTLADRHHGREIDKTDGFMMMFERPIQAVGFALDYQRGLKQLNAAEQVNLSARVGIHVGDVVVWDNSAEDIAKGAKPTEVEGLVKPVTSRLMNLALPGQILLSNIAYSLAHRAQGELGEYLETARWRTHGRYRFRGVPDPVAVFEVGEEDLAPLKAPPWSSKAHREVPFWRRPTTVVFEALIIAVLIAVPLVMFLRPDPAIAFAQRDWVVVGSLHNLTGETVFDDALEGALRIGLEQSRYVNVMPDLKVRDTITRMQRDPDQTKVDRVVGSEVAIRDGARALILPTIAEIGGRVRITAEVIDPHTQTTVYSETADGIGKESILPSLDTINERLRVRLGEALATVSNESMPLEKVATENLDSLKAFSLATTTSNKGDIIQANVLLKNAIALDPNFSRARIDLAGALLIQGHREEARKQLNTALTSEERLSPRDKFMAEAMLADFVSPRESLRKWKALAQSFPDFFPAQGTYGFYAWAYANDYSEALEATKRNAVAQNPNRGTGIYLLATLLTGREQYSEAAQQFALAESLGIHYQNTFYAAAYAAQRNYKKVAQLLAAGRAADSENTRISLQTYKLAFAIDQGKWDESRLLLDGPDRQRMRLSEENASQLHDAELGTRMILASENERSGLGRTDKLLSGQESMQSADESEYSRNSSLLFRAYMASKYMNDALATKLLDKVDTALTTTDFPDLIKLKAIVDAQRKLSNKSSSVDVQTLNGLVDGTELNVTHLLLMEAFERTGDYRSAREQARWLASHRGRAYTQSSVGSAFVPFDVAQSNLALLYDAEYSSQLGQQESARRALSEFEKVWPLDGSPEWIAARAKTLRAKLAKQAN
ncbi:MAG TPA: putative peptide modification system cyclase [Dokdonella sp.]|uniref:putative peptide modification system cyclase n=1 Tax=Dokdonella sp. TaxID=2291710 RepID=UPI002D7EDFBB|nr:putative peptide modification system cyclase [Dokdonella sp.]HET9031397.1 putative peptide modification system cyclase [Dokdonella sp.]